ncbi:hypothetical protein KUCAC02_004978, partial [Chaenocephalus aceratus]
RWLAADGNLIPSVCSPARPLRQREASLNYVEVNSRRWQRDTVAGPENGALWRTGEFMRPIRSEELTELCEANGQQLRVSLSGVVHVVKLRRQRDKPARKVFVSTPTTHTTSQLSQRDSRGTRIRSCLDRRSMLEEDLRVLACSRQRTQRQLSPPNHFMKNARNTANNLSVNGIMRELVGTREVSVEESSDGSRETLRAQCEITGSFLRSVSTPEDFGPVLHFPT